MAGKSPCRGNTPRDLFVREWMIAAVERQVECGTGFKPALVLSPPGLFQRENFFAVGRLFVG